MSATVAYHHIGFQGDQPVVRPYGIKLTQLVVEHLVHGWSPTELCYQHPGLEMGQVHSALAYY